VKPRPPIGFVLGIVGTLLCGQLAAAASLDALQSTWPELNLRATLEAGPSPEVEQGSNMRLRISADEEASVAIVVVNADGKARVSVPRREGAQARVVRGTEMLFPDTVVGETLYADMPVGTGYIYVVGSERQLFQPADVDAGQWTDANAVSERIAAAMRQGSGMRVSTSRIPLYVVAPEMKEFISEDEFVQFYAVATRSVPNAGQGFPIEFAHDSAQLTDWSRRQLDAVGKGMRRDALAKFRFRLEGHTDDVGAEPYNMDLSDRRARAVREYLVAQGVPVKRLDTAAMGEGNPAMPGTSDEARGKNRRVVIRRLDTSN
jgi:outer membrane protein OmpA-like peptidoglycan-associated protein